MEALLLSSSIAFTIIFFHLPHSLAQAPPPSSSPTNITAILQHGGQFATLIKLLKSTNNADQINTQLNNSNQGLTVLAPTDNAFSKLQLGTLNSLSDQQKVQLVQYHTVSRFISLPDFQTVSNPLRTQAGGSDSGEFQLNVTTSGDRVNITTGVNNTTLGNTVFSDGQLAVYQVEDVLLPKGIFGRVSSPSPVPAPAETRKRVPVKAPPDSGSSTANSSAARRNSVVPGAAFMIAVVLLLVVQHSLVI